jgi:hypothetical protein
MSDDLIALDELAELLREREGPAKPESRRPRVRRRRAVVVAALAAAVVAGIVAALVVPSDEQPSSPLGGSAGGSYAAAVEWHGTTYFGGSVRGKVVRGGSLGKGTLPACGDGGPVTPASSVGVVAIEGVPPEQAVAVRGRPDVVYTAPGWLPQVPNTPLHDVLYGGDEAKPNERSECEPGRTATAEVRARIRGGGGGGLTVTLLEPTSLPHENWIFPDARTAVSGGGSPPRVEPGEVIRAQVLVCRQADDPHFLKLVATRLRLGG